MARRIRVDLARQTLVLEEGDAVLHRYAVSTGAKGAGEMRGSEQTPRGLHRIRLRIGHACPVNTVFVGRRPTGEVYSTGLARLHPHRDWILTRILWLTGLEPGRNRGGAVDSLRRFVYIHGTPDTEPMGRPCSHGCIRMRNSDVVELFDLVRIRTLVEICEGRPAQFLGEPFSPG
jgi:lipoprotein-anchoring transpeptidase ErfK/SrfK